MMTVHPVVETVLQSMTRCGYLFSFVKCPHNEIVHPCRQAKKTRKVSFFQVLKKKSLFFSYITSLYISLLSMVNRGVESVQLSPVL